MPSTELNPDAPAQTARAGVLPETEVPGTEKFLSGNGEPGTPTEAPTAKGSGPRLPSRWDSIWLFVRSDLGAMARSWLCRGFLLASMVLTVLELKGMQAGQKPANQMLETVYTTYLLVWMHGIIFIAGAALMREADCLNDAILCRGVTRAEYIIGKLVSRCLAVLLIVAGVLLPTSIWAIRQDKLVRTEDGFVNSAARNTKVEAWDPKKVFAEVAGTVKQMTLKVGDFVKVGDVVAMLDDRAIFDELENDRRAEENARNEVNNARRKAEDARRNVGQAEDALEKAERGLIAKDLMSKAEQADRQTEIRTRKRDLNNAENQLRVAEDAVPPAERAVENAMAKVRDARRQLANATITAPISGYVTEILANQAQYLAVGAQVCTIAPLDDYQIRIPIYRYEEFKRLKTNLTAYIKIEQTEYKGVIERLGATTQPDRWNRDYNYALVRFNGEGALGLLGLPADVRLVLPPPAEKPSKAAAILNAITGRQFGASVTRTSSVTFFWMLISLGKVIGTACLVVTFTLTLLILFRNSLIAILGAIGLYHISNLIYDFTGLKDLSYLEMVSTMDKVLGGVAKPMDEWTTLAWLFGLAAAFGVLAAALFISRDPPK